MKRVIGGRRRERSVMNEPTLPLLVRIVCPRQSIMIFGFVVRETSKSFAVENCPFCGWAMHNEGHDL